MKKVLYLLFIITLCQNIPLRCKAQAVTPISGLGSVCMGSTLALSDSTTGGKWSSSDTSIATVDSVLGIVTGVSAGSVTITYSIDTSYATKSITVDTFRSAGFITGADSVCVNGSITLLNSFSGGTWTVSNGLAKDTAGIVTGLSGGIDTVMYIVTNACGSDTASFPVTIIPLPMPFDILGDPGVCVGVPRTYSDGAPLGIWLVTNSNATISPLGVLTPVALGKDTILYSITNFCGSDTVKKPITILTTPVAPLISGPATLCVGQTIHLSDTVRGVWSASNTAVAISGSADIYGVNAGIDTVWFKVSNICGIDTAAQVLTINPLPAIPPISRTKNLLSVPSGYSAYQWTMNGNTISGATDNSYNVTSLQNYFVIVSNSYGCTVTSPSQTITQLECTAQDLKIFPNPATSAIYLNWCEKVTAELISIDGKLLKSAKNTNQVDISLLPNGSYLLKIFDANGNKLQTSQVKKVAR